MKSQSFESIKRLYKDIDVTEYNPYPIDWVSTFTPIEYSVWCSIRAKGGLPFWPQLPIGRYFADFADPVKKIVIECDGAAFHQDKEKDARRDRDMAANGWTVFRVPGCDCERVLPCPASINEMFCEERIDEQKAIEAVEAWYLTTAEGLVSSIAENYYGHKRRINGRLAKLIDYDLSGKVLFKRVAA